MPSILAVNNDVPAKSVAGADRARQGAARQALLRQPRRRHAAAHRRRAVQEPGRCRHRPRSLSGRVFTDVIGGRVTMTLQNAGAILPTRARRQAARARGHVAASARPTCRSCRPSRESGFPDFEAVSWFGLLAPAGTPAPIVAKLHQETVKIAGAARHAREIRAARSRCGRQSARRASPRIIKSDIAKWAKVIKDAGIRLSE